MIDDLVIEEALIDKSITPTKSKKARGFDNTNPTSLIENSYPEDRATDNSVSAKLSHHQRLARQTVTQDATEALTQQLPSLDTEQISTESSAPKEASELEDFGRAALVESIQKRSRVFSQQSALKADQNSDDTLTGFVPTLNLKQALPKQSHEQVLLARQPIFDSSLKTVAHELLFRPPNTGRLQQLSGDQATSQVIINAFTEIGFKKVSDNKPVFINFTRKWLIDPPPFDPSQVIIEVLESIEMDAEVVEALQRLADQGFTIALDDFVYTSAWEDALRIAHIVKLDVLELDRSTLEAWVTRLRCFNVKLLAEKIETKEMFAYCRKLGFELFQGYLLKKPEVIKGQPVAASRLVTMQLLVELQDDTVNLERIERLTLQDPILTVKFLQLFNQSNHGENLRFDKLDLALNIVGIGQSLKWLHMLALSQLTDKPHALSLTAFSRARMCEQLAIKARFKDSDRFFFTGLFSTLDAFFDLEIEIVLEAIGLDLEQRDAIMGFQGTQGRVLKTVIAHEFGIQRRLDWTMLSMMSICAQTLDELYFESLEWGQRMSNHISV